MRDRRGIARHFVQVVAVASAGTGVAALAGQLGVAGLRELASALSPRLAAMLVLAAFALWTTMLAPAARRLRRAGQICGLAVVALAAWSLAVRGVSTAAAFVSIGAGLTLVDRRIRNRPISDYLALAAIAIALLALLGHLFGARPLYELPGDLPRFGLTIARAVFALLLGLALLAARIETGVIAVVLADDTGGTVARRLFGGLLVFPVVAVALIEGAHAGLYAMSVGSALVLLVAVAQATVSILATARGLSRADVALRGSEARVRSLVEEAADPIFIADLAGRYTEVNAAACRLLGYARDELVGMRITDLIPPEDVPRLAVSKEKLARGEVDVGEWTLRRKDGAAVPVEVSAKIFPDGRWQGIVRDITERRRAAAALAESERSRRAELEELLRAVSETVHERPAADVETLLRAIAERGRALVGAAHAAIGIGGDDERAFDRWITVGMPDELASALRVPRPVGVLGLARAGEVVRISEGERPAFRGLPAVPPGVGSLLAVPIVHEGRTVGTLYFANKDGAPAFTDDDATAARALAGRVAAAIATVTRYDIERTKRAWLQSIIDQLPEGVLVLGERGEVKAINPALAALGRQDVATRDPWGNLEWFDVRDLDRKPLPFDELPVVRALRHGETIRDRELVLCLGGDHYVPVAASARPLRDEAQRIAGAIAVVTDISERKELERLREEWIAVVAHDLRQPLNTILLWGDRLFAIAADDRQRDAVARIQRAGWRLNRMVQDLLDAARIAATRLAIEPQLLDAVACVRSVVDTARGEHAGAVFELTAPARELVWADPDRVEQVVANLLSNAVKYRTPGTPIRVAITGNDHAVEIAIANAGPEIAAEERERLFARFVRTRQARDAGIPGIGLGLYITKGLVEAQGGRIWLESRGGTNTFRFTLLRPPQ